MNEIAVDDLVGLSYVDAGGCYGLVRTVVARMGYVLPADPAHALECREGLGVALAAGETPRAGDIVVMPGGGGYAAHLGAMVDGWRCIEVGSGYSARIVRLETLETAGVVKEILRLVQMPTAAPVGITVYAEPLPAEIKLITFDNLLSRSNRRVVTLPITSGMTAGNLLAGLEIATGERHLVAVNGMALSIEEAAQRKLTSGDVVVVGGTMGEPGTIVLAAIAVISAIASGIIASSVRLPEGNDSGTQEERRYGFGRVSNEAFAGDVVPVVLGAHPRWGGKVVAVVPGNDGTGGGDNTAKILLCLGHGQFNRIGSYTGDVTNADGVSATGLYLNDQPLSNFPGCRISVRMGTSGQAIIPGFDDIEVYQEVGVGGVVLRNTSGSVRSGGSPSGEAFTFSTDNAVNAVVVRVRFASGLFTSSAAGTLQARAAAWRYRVRTTDVGAGAGAWGSWTVVNVSQAQRSEVISAPRFGGGGAWNGGTAARMDVQVERVSIEPGDALSVDEMTLDSVVQITDAELNFAGYAMLALELKASDQLTGVPRVSCDVEGYAGLRIWDGISPPSAPVFTVGYSANPADLCLEVLTNAVWGMGAMYDDNNIDFTSLFAWRTACSESVARPGGGTRSKFACALVMNDARDGVDWVRTIARVGRAVPITMGNRWQFAYDGPRTTPVERFTDGSIAAGSDGAAEFEYAREVVTGGRERPNQWILQVENAAERGLPDAFVYPADGDLWLEDEPVNTDTRRLDGVTDPDQIASELVYIAKRERGLSRSIALTTVRDVVVVQPGDRFDVSIGVMGWGMASGRLEEGSTASAVALDKPVILADAITYYVRVMHLDGTDEHREITSAAGTYAAGELLTLESDLSQSPAAGVGPAGAAEYALGALGIEQKPFICTAVRMANVESRTWNIEGIEYASDIYDDEAAEVTMPEYAAPIETITAPGPVLSLNGREIVTGNGVRVELSWSQSPADAALTASYRIYRRIIGAPVWVLVPESIIAQRGGVIEIADIDVGYEFVVVAVSLGGALLSPTDSRHPRYSLVIGLAAPTPGTPTDLVATQVSGNTYDLTWNPAVEQVEVAGYCVMFGGDATALPNAGGEDCLILARTTLPELRGLELPPGRSCTFWVRSVGANQRMSVNGASVTIATPGTPSGESIRATNGTKVFTLASDGILNNLYWDGARLLQVNTAEPGVWLSPEVDYGSAALTEITFRPHTDNAAQDISIGGAPLVVPSVPADQWGVIDSGGDVGMIWPPWPDTEVSWSVEVRTNDGTNWGTWAAWAPLTRIRTNIRKYQVRITMRRARAPYRAGLSGFVVVGTA